MLKAALNHAKHGQESRIKIRHYRFLDTDDLETGACRFAGKTLDPEIGWKIEIRLVGIIHDVADESILKVLEQRV